MPTRPRWKFAEDALARLFGTRRRPLSGSGSASGGSDDAMHKTLYLESKYGKQCNAFWNLYRDTKAKATKEGKTPVIGLQEPRTHGVLLVIHSADLPRVIEEYQAAQSEGDTVQESHVKEREPPSPPRRRPPVARRPKRETESEGPPRRSYPSVSRREGS